MISKREIEMIEEKQRGWEEKSLKNNKTERPEKYTTLSHIPIKNVYTPVDLKNSEYLRDLNFPGEYPYTRGIFPQMYRERPYVVSQYAGFGTSEDTNKWYKYLLAQGTNRLAIAFDLPTQVGLDSDHPMAKGEVGKIGVAIDSLQDMETVFDGIPFKGRMITANANSIAPIIVAMFIAVGEKQGFSMNEFAAGVQNDVLKEFIARGTYIFPPKPSVKLCCDIIEFCAKNGLHTWSPISISGAHIRAAGSNVTQELGFTLANAICYIEEMLRRGIPIDDFARVLGIFFGSHIDLFEEACKFRAVRRMWAKIMNERFGAQKPESMALHLTSYTAGVRLTAQQPLNNIVRVTIELLAAMLGGVQSAVASSYDEALAIPSEEAVRVALRTQQILVHETNILKTADPLGGSYFLEALTNEIEKGSFEYIEKIDKMGGAVEAVENGYFMKEISEEAFKQQREVETGERIVVGVNQFQSDAEEDIRLHQSNPKGVKIQKEKLKILRKQRDNQRLKGILNSLKRSAEEGENLMPILIDAVKAYGTVGEICDVLRTVYGEYKESRVFI